MSTTPADLLESVLRACAAAAPDSWYPKAHADHTGIGRDQLLACTGELCDRGLLRPAEWIQGRGQGYALTAAGEAVLADPGRLTGSPKEEAAGGATPRAARAGYRHEAVRAVLRGGTRPWVTHVLFWANVAVFAVGLYLGFQDGAKLNDFLLQSPPKVLRLTGAVDRGYLAQGAWWRLLTNCFVHIGLVHLAVNMYSLYLIGPVGERMWGRWRYLALYLIAGLGGSCAQIFVTRGGLLAGASGALWGLMTSLGVWTILNRAYLPRGLAWHQLGQLASVLILNIFISFLPGIGTAAHFGGGAVGAVVAVFLNGQRFGGSLTRAVATLGILLTPVLCVGALVKEKQLRHRWEEWRQPAPDPVMLAPAQPEAGPEAAPPKNPLVRAGLLLDQVDQFYQEHVNGLLIIPGDKPPRDEVKIVLGPLRNQEARLNEAARILQDQPDDEDQDQAEARRVCGRYLMALRELTRRAAEALAGAAEWDDKLADELARLKRRAQQSRANWQRWQKRLDG